MPGSALKEYLQCPGCHKMNLDLGLNFCHLYLANPTVVSAMGSGRRGLFPQFYY